MPSQSVLVIGGGLAGLSSAVVLAEAGFRVRLFEKRPHLGGRATSYTLPDGSEVDNCQHVTLGCCTNLADFYRRAGAAGKIRFYDRLYFAGAQGRRWTVKASWLPPPIHMAPAFVRFGALRLEDKKCIANALLAIARTSGAPPDADGVSMLDWLRRRKQTQRAIDRFWRVVLVSALDEELGRMDSRYGIAVLWKAFLANRGGYHLGIPSVPLAELYAGCREAVVQRGGEVQTRSGVREIRVEGKRFVSAALEDGSDVQADACLLAVPHNAILDLLPSAMSARGACLEGLRNIQTSPITSIHLWFDRTVMKEPFLALFENTTQWIFNKTLLYAGVATDANVHPKGENTAPHGLKPQYLQLVISASYDLVQRSRQEIINLGLRELNEILPLTREATLQKATVIKEINATFSPAPGVDRWRPQQHIGMDNLFLAGDWTSTGWPATMEGAVRSGYLAAEALLASLGRPRKFLQPDLPLQGLSRHWAMRERAAAT